MDLETQIKKLQEEGAYLDKWIDGLKELKKRKGYTDCLEDIINLIDKLKHKRKLNKKDINELTTEVIEAAEAEAGIDFIVE